MKRFTGGLGAVVLSLGALVVAGCGESNEDAINAQASKSSEADVKNPVKPVSNQRDVFKDATSPFTKESQYPGAKK